MIVLDEKMQWKNLILLMNKNLIVCTFFCTIKECNALPDRNGV